MDKTTCAEPECLRASHARGLCGPHYTKHYRLGTLPPRAERAKRCVRPGCGRDHYLRNLCLRHYERWRESRKRCSQEGCDRGVRTRGLCGAHYQIARRADLTTCSASGCEQKSNSGGLCNRHYKQKRRESNPPCSVDWCEQNAAMMGMCNTHHAQVWRIGALIPDEFECGECAGRFRRSEWRLQGSALRCPRCQIKAGSVHRWCMTVDELAQRDGTDCAICREPVDMTLRRPNLMCPSVEHIIPRARGGLDVPENLALAHLICNMRKGAAVA